MPKLSLTLQDGYGRVTRKLYEVEVQADIAAYTAVATSLVTALDVLTDLAGIRVDLILDGLVGGFNGTATSNVDVGATFSGLIDGGNGKKASHKVPGINIARVELGTGQVDLTHPDVSTYLALFETGGPLMLSDGETIDTWIAGTLDK